jgi:alanine racemase
MKNYRSSRSQTRRDAWLEINLSALEHNATRIRQQLGDTELMAVIKADAYGHGARMVAPVLQASGVTQLGVASLDEALELRHSGVTLPILVLGPAPDWALSAALEYQIQLTVFHPHHLQAIRSAALPYGASIPVHIKVDTGMHRIGVAWDNVSDFYRSCLATPGVQVQGLFSHLASGDQLTPTLLQVERWRHAVDAWPEAVLPPARHLSNTPGALGLWQPAELNTQLPPRYQTMARIGMGFWGYTLTGMQPVMGLKARITHLQTVPAGEGISYGGGAVDSQQMRHIATLPLGYADGIPRALSNRLWGSYQGRLIRQVGTITMDQMMWDVTPPLATESHTLLQADQPQIGDVITLLDSCPIATLGTRDPANPGEPTLSLAAWATALTTIEYELMCGLRVRLPKVYTRT